jgi:hypothetical protein
MIFCDAKKRKRSLDSLHFDSRDIINTAGYSWVIFRFMALPIYSASTPHPYLSFPSPIFCLALMCFLSFRVCTELILVTVSLMEHKRDATVAGLGWPSNSNRGTSSTKNDTEPGCQAFELSHPAAPAHSTSTTSAPPEANAIANDLGTTSQFDTYSAPTQPDVPFPTEQSSTFNVFHRSRFSSRVVHQIQFKIFTHSNNTRELFIEEIPTSGVSKCRDPEHYFYNLSGNWEWSLRTADYWRYHFELPLHHGQSPFHDVSIASISPSETPSLTTKIRDLAKQLSDALTAAMASGEINETWRMVEGMSFRDAIQILQLEANFPSE